MSFVLTFGDNSFIGVFSSFNVAIEHVYNMKCYVVWRSYASPESVTPMKWKQSGDYCKGYLDGQTVASYTIMRAPVDCFKVHDLESITEFAKQNGIPPMDELYEIVGETANAD